MQATIDNDLIAFANRLADRAGDIARQYFRQPIGVETKADASPVTLADREIETALRAMIEAEYPDHGIVGEEFGNLRPHAALQWVIDPIDGTRAFIAGYPLFTTLIALVGDGVPMLGVIDQPILRERWLGASGHAFYHIGALPPMSLRSSSRAEPASAVLATTSTDYFTPQQAEVFARVKAKCGRSVIGGDAYAYAMLASGGIDIVIDAGLKPYDFCALVPVVEGAGGIITDWNGKPLTLAGDGRVIAAASRELWQTVMALL